MLLEEATAYTKDCFTGEPAPCSNACPFHMDVRSFLDKVSRQKWNSAYKAYRNAVVFPVIVSSICPQPCREKCQRPKLGDESLAMRDIEAACVLYSKNKKADFYAIPPKDKRVAVVGAGVAGLACAFDLSNKKYSVTVFDKNPGWGGHLRKHTLFDSFDEDIRSQFDTVNTEFRFDTEITSLDQLDEYDAVYIATGTGGSDFGLASGWDSVLETTKINGVFMGGEVCGRSETESIAISMRTARIIEGYVQTGRAELGHGEFNGCDHELDFSGTLSAPAVKMESPEGYSKDEAAREASRCMMCDCNKCYRECELLEQTSKRPGKMAVEVYSDANANPPIATHELTRVTYSCNDCGHCKRVCPESVDIGALLRFSRESRFGTKNEPKALHWFWLREMDFAVNEASFSGIPDGKEKCSYAFFPGCQLGASNPDHVLNSYSFLRKNYDAGIILGCCGAPAYWAGDVESREKNHGKIKEIWSAMGEPTLVFACATCESIFSRLMPEIPRVTLYELMRDKGLTVDAGIFKEAAVFDPCAAEENTAAKTAVRELCSSGGMVLSEHRDKGRCCGYGGQMKTANRKLFEKIAGNRITASDLPYVVWCANCREVYASRGKDCAHVLDLIFGTVPGDVPSFEEKRKNSLRVKDEIMKQITGSGYTVQEKPWDSIAVEASAELQKIMDERLITMSDVRETIWNGEQNKEYFRDPDGGSVLTRMVTPILTYWVEYKFDGGVYHLIDAYTHRMHFREGV